MKGIISTSLLLISLIIVFNCAGQDTISSKSFIGKWTKCYTSELDTTINCNGEWEFEFLRDGTYRENRKQTINYVKHEFVYGTWSFEDGILTIDENDSQWHEAGPNTYTLEQIREGLFYEKCIEEVKRKTTIYVFVYFQKIE